MLTDTTHRPWAIPETPWALSMSWHDLLFIHWPLPAELLRPLIPMALELDTFDEQAWIGIVPFRMTRVRPRYVPALPWVSAFLELNVRTYVQTQGKPGVWFFSLDAANPVAVRCARWAFRLPYYDARMSLTSDRGGFSYRSIRMHRNAAPAVFQGWYAPTGPGSRASPGTLDHWLTERYCLYATDKHARLWRGDIHHRPWPLQPAEAVITTNTMLQQLGLQAPATAPLLHFVARQDVVAWLLRQIEPD